MITIPDIAKAAKGSVDFKISQEQAEMLIKAVFSEINKHVDEGDDVMIYRFGRFYRKTSKARTARNPATGEPVQVPERHKLCLKPTKMTDKL